MVYHEKRLERLACGDSAEMRGIVKNAPATAQRVMRNAVSWLLLKAVTTMIAMAKAAIMTRGSIGRRLEGLIFSLSLPPSHLPGKTGNVVVVPPAPSRS